MMLTELREKSSTPWAYLSCYEDVNYMLIKFDNESDAFDWLTTKRGSDKTLDFEFLRSAERADQPIQEWLDYEREELGDLTDWQATVYIYERWCMTVYREFNNVDS